MDRNRACILTILICTVALRKESVDRNNLFANPGSTELTVALRKESVDRNYKERPGQKARPNVALRKESVDRNFHAVQIVIVIVQSLSARRAWIEMLLPMYLLKFGMSLSARRAWIEISIDDLEPSSTRSRSPQGERG